MWVLILCFQTVHILVLYLQLLLVHDILVLLLVHDVLPPSPPDLLQCSVQGQLARVPARKQVYIHYCNICTLIESITIVVPQWAQENIRTS